MKIFFNLETLSLLVLTVAMLIIAYSIFIPKKYNNSYIIDNTSKIIFLVEFFLISLLFLVSISTFLSQFSTYIDTPNIIIFILGLIIGSVVVKVNCRYYIHDGLIALGALIALWIMFILLIQDNPSENNWLSFILGITGSLLVLPLYGHILNTFSKRNTVITTLLFISMFFIFIAIGEIFLLSNTLFSILVTTIVLYLLYRYRGMIFWLFIEWVIKLRYKVIYKGIEHLSEESTLLFISNHISWIDGLVIQLPMKRRIHCIVNKGIYDKWYFNPLFRVNGCIPISKKSFRKGIGRAKKLLEQKHAIAMFPEGSISKTGELGRFYQGMELLAGSYEGDIVPVYIDGLWGSILSRSKKKFSGEKSGFRRVVRVYFGSLLPLDTSAKEVKEAIKQLQNRKIGEENK